MEIDRPTAADYAVNAADHARQVVEGASVEAKALEERVALLELKVRGLFSVVNYMLGEQVSAEERKLDDTKFDDEGNVIVEKGEDHE